MRAIEKEAVRGRFGKYPGCRAAFPGPEGRGASTCANGHVVSQEVGPAERACGEICALFSETIKNESVRENLRSGMNGVERLRSLKAPGWLLREQRRQKAIHRVVRQAARQAGGMQGKAEIHAADSSIIEQVSSKGNQ